jgi:hypothetical protein
VERLAERLEQADRLVVAEKSGDLGAKLVDVKDEAVGESHVVHRLGKQGQDWDEAGSPNGDLKIEHHPQTFDDSVDRHESELKPATNVIKL